MQQFYIRSPCGTTFIGPLINTVSFYIEILVQERRSSIANALEILNFYTKL